ncbi:transcription elongation factor TFIIS-like [Magnolia sinica]|uniref:transcription elongation factor TFIIS-like n=1 Tax=Magnolia sinica TaxID=86752 RepID=UPI00265A9977|nr:transcription elongation factor TFIIS-like [Magnolia sinica]
MEKEVVEIFEAAKRAADAAAAAATDGAQSGGPDESRCVEALKRLRDLPVTMQILISTQVGKRLRSLTKHPMEKIQAIASDLLGVWKNIVIEETAKDNKKISNPSSKNSTNLQVRSERAEAVKMETVKANKSQNPERMKAEDKFKRSQSVKVEKVVQSVKAEKLSRSESLKVEKIGENDNTVQVEKIHEEEKQAALIRGGPPKLTSMIKCNDSMRDKLRELLAEAFSKVSTEADEDMMDQVNACDPIRVAVSVESVMYEKMGRSNGVQKVKYRSVMFNLKDSNNPDLRRRVLLGHIKPERLIDMTPEEMASDKRKQENTVIKEKALFECERGGAPEATTDQFKCGRCGQRKTTYYQLQTRSADEPMTTFVTCVNCNHHWKFC